MSRIDSDLMRLIQLEMLNLEFSDAPVRDIAKSIADNYPKISMVNFTKSWNQLKREGKIIETRAIKTHSETIRLYKWVTALE